MQYAGDRKHMHQAIEKGRKTHGGNSEARLQDFPPIQSERANAERYWRGIASATARVAQKRS